jgi:hypothetical protein
LLFYYHQDMIMNIKKTLSSIASAVAIMGAMSLASAQTSPDSAPVSGRNGASSAAGAARAPSTSTTTPAANSAAPSAAAGTAGTPDDAAIGRASGAAGKDKVPMGTMDNSSAGGTKTGPTSDSSAIGRPAASTKPANKRNYKKRNRSASADKGSKDNEAVGR